MQNRFDSFWHKLLSRPYKLAVTTDVGHGTPVILLHGLGVSGEVWAGVAARLDSSPCRLIICDLLGFGASPKPDWARYTIDDHARAVYRTLRSKRVKGPIILVGHSMGALISARIASQHPMFVKHLILFEMPLYIDLPKSLRYELRKNLYFALYRRVLMYPEFSDTNVTAVQKIAAKLVGFKVNKETWLSFVRSLENSIMKQSTLQDLKRINVPTEVIYGALDALVIRGNPKHVFADVPKIRTRVIAGGHYISPHASDILARQIKAELS